MSREGLALDPAKITSMIEWPTPTKLKEVQGFLRLANYYCKFIESFSGIVAPLTNLIKKDQIVEDKIRWTDECKKAFTSIKKQLTTAPILTIFNPEKEVTLETDVSNYAIGARIAQKSEDGKLRPVTYFSRKIIPVELNYNIYNKELLAIVKTYKL
jgi:hypothetical protein